MRLKLLLAALTLSTLAYAEKGPYYNRPTEQVTNVTQTCVSTQNITGINVAQTAALAINGTPVPWKSATVQNQDSTKNVFWHYDINVTTNGTGQGVSTTGFKIAPGAIVTFALLPGVSYYLLNDATSGNALCVVGACR